MILPVNLGRKDDNNESQSENDTGSIWNTHEYWEMRFVCDFVCIFLNESCHIRMFLDMNIQAGRRGYTNNKNRKDRKEQGKERKERKEHGKECESRSSSIPVSFTPFKSCLSSPSNWSSRRTELTSGSLLWRWHKWWHHRQQHPLGSRQSHLTRSISLFFSSSLLWHDFSRDPKREYFVSTHFCFISRTIRRNKTSRSERRTRTIREEDF